MMELRLKVMYFYCCHLPHMVTTNILHFEGTRKMSFFLLLLLCCLYIDPALSISLSLPNCPQYCGNLTIPYPFGIGSNCSANSSFTIICQNSTNPILSSIKMEVVQIFLRGAVIINVPVSPVNCSSELTPRTVPLSLQGTPFTISAEYNTLVNLGCKNSVWLQNNTSTIGGCTPICDANSTDTTCNGVNCCQATIPHQLQELQYAYQSTGAGNGNGNVCGYVFPVDKKWFQVGYNLSNPFDIDFGFAPLVLEWELNDSAYHFSKSIDCTDSGTFFRFCNQTMFLRRQFPFPFNYLLLSKICHDPRRFFSILFSSDEYESTTRYCHCADGFEGNPYLDRGCRDIDECSNATLCRDGTCVNTHGSFYCGGYAGGYPNDEGSGNIRTRIKIAAIVIGSMIGALILLYGAWRSGNTLRKVMKAIQRYRNYKRNGGLLLEQHLASTDTGLEKTKLFGSRELSQATDRYNENRILGRGGQGTVYKGMLTDGNIVAVKKSKKLGAGGLEVFINEVVIMSQVNHRNVVKLLGCCLETEVPLLVYEFIPNGTLFQHIHEPNEELPLTWEMRVRIAAEVAGALSYLHCAASAPIYHRDIKSTNILLDEKYRAKVSDFGTSRSVTIDQTHLTTRVIGTFGYLDPEYFQSSQFTEKSDVYSFGVVMVELLTGEKAVCSVRAESGKSLATHFLNTMEENHLFDIVDARVLKEGRREEIVAIAELAQRCLHLNGRRRPTMKEVAVDLEGIQRGVKEGTVSLSLQDHDDSIDNPSVELYDESSWDFSSISGSIHMDTTAASSKEVENPLIGEP